MSYYQSVLKDSPVGFWKLDESSGSISYDSSGCGNNGSYVGSINKILIPLVPGGIHANKITNTQKILFPITKDFSGQTGVGGFAIEKTEDNDFSLEVWFHPKNITSLTPILADTNGIGIYWDNGNIVFKIESERIDYTVPYKNKLFHVVATYQSNSIKLYVDSELVISKYIDPIVFSNTSLVLESGPSLVNENFLVDAPAVYRYALTINQIKSHYLHIYKNLSVQIASSNFGQLFKSTLQHQYNVDQFILPSNIPFGILENDDIKYKKSSNSLYLTSSSGYFLTSISLMHWKQYISSKIEWFGGEGIRVYSSLVSDAGPWIECTNGSVLPQIKMGQNVGSITSIYLKVEFLSTDITKYIPELYYLGVYLYQDKKLNSHNGRSYISTSQPTSGSNWDVDFSNREYQMYSRNFDNGIRSLGAGFFANTVDNIRSIETVLTPVSLSSGYLMYNKTNGVEYSLSWDSNGTITKSNISNLYINGQDISSATNISSYLNIDEPNYILIKTSANISGQIWFNTKSENNVRSGSLANNIYNLICLYESSSINHLTNYNFYIGNEKISVSDSGITITEFSAPTNASEGGGISRSITHDYDWQLLNNQ